MKNSVMLIGYPTQPVMDSENRKASFQLVVTEWKNGSNIANTFDCIALNDMATRIVQRVVKKKRIAIDGSLRSYDYKDRLGDTHTKIEIEVSNLFVIDATRD